MPLDARYCPCCGTPQVGCTTFYPLRPGEFVNVTLAPGAPVYFTVIPGSSMQIVPSPVAPSTSAAQGYTGPPIVPSVP